MMTLKTFLSKNILKKHFLCPVIFFLILFNLSHQPAIANDGWLYFSKDKSSWNTKYYYDSESVQYFPDNHVSVWMKIRNSGREKALLTEISCSSSLFRIIQAPPRDPWDFIYQKPPAKTQYVVSGWLEIPPDSEVKILKRLLCNNPKKSWNY